MQKFNINLVKSFLIAFICFAKISSLIKNSFDKNSLSLRGFAEAIYMNWIASLSFAMTIKNNFAILNNNVASASACRWQAHCATQGVRQRRPFGKTPCYLTSITFDSLSRKIKNPCLVIKKLHQKEIFKMKILKTKTFFTYVVVGALVMALSVSCSNEDKTGGNNDNSYTHQNHPAEGIYSNGYYNSSAIVSNNADGSCHITGKAYFDAGNSQNFDITVRNWTQEYESTFSYAGSSDRDGEANISTPPNMSYFEVSYNSSGAFLRIDFGPADKRYTTSSLSKQ